MASPRRVVRCGWLGSASLNTPMRQDWWVLTAADALTSFVSNSDSSTADCNIPLSSVISVCSGHNSRSFQLKTGTKAYSFTAESDDSAESWRGAIDEARKLVPKPVAPAPEDSSERAVASVKKVLVELDMILQALASMLCGGEQVLLERYRVQLTMSAVEREQLLAQLGFTDQLDESKTLTLCGRMHMNAATMLSQAEAEHRALLQQEPNQLQPATLAQIGENTKRLAALSVMMQAVEEERDTSFNTGGGFGGLRIHSSIHTNSNLEQEVLSLQNTNLGLSTEVQSLKQSLRDTEDQLQLSQSQWQEEPNLHSHWESEQLQQQLKGSRSDLTDLQAKYVKLREYATGLQQRCHNLEASFEILQEYIEDHISADQDSDLNLDTKLASLTADTSGLLQPWQQLLQFKLVPALKVMKHSIHQQDQTGAKVSASVSDFQDEVKEDTATLREQLAVSERQIMDQSSQLLELSCPAQVSLQHTAALEARNRELEAELATLESKQRTLEQGLTSTDVHIDTKHSEISILETKKSELEQEIAALEAKKHELGASSDDSRILELEFSKVEGRNHKLQLKVNELEHVVSTLQQEHAESLVDFENEMAKGQSLNQELFNKYGQLQQKANDTMKKLKQLKSQLQEKEHHREEILRQAQTSFNELKDKYVALEQSHQERKHLLKTNEWNRLELNRMVERIRELEELQNGTSN